MIAYFHGGNAVNKNVLELTGILDAIKEAAKESKSPTSTSGRGVHVVRPNSGINPV